MVPLFPTTLGTSLSNFPLSMNTTHQSSILTLYRAPQYSYELISVYVHIKGNKLDP
uniref:Uncharacterized protein n=1 Tax=Rhizophora mucronata TaxID=61149 RepID=A0A2P2MY89_RHIMU